MGPEQLLFVGVPSGERSPQTAVLQPVESAPTYIGWLGRDHRTLPKAAVDHSSTQIANCDVVMITLEASEEAIYSTLEHTRAGALIVLTASPVPEWRYRIDTAILERVAVVIGSAQELHALLAPNSASRVSSRSASSESSARDLASLCGPTVIATDLRTLDRRVVGVNPFISEPVRVRSPRVRMTEHASTRGALAAIGSPDVFSAAFALECCALDDAKRLPPRRGVWRSDASPLAQNTNLVDVLLGASLPEAWVARSRDGGYTNFPRRDAAFLQWSQQHPPEYESADASDGDVSGDLT